MNDAGFGEMWQEAISGYEREVKLDLDSSQVPHPRSLDELLELLRDRHDDFFQDTSSGLKLSKRLRNFIGPINMAINMFGGVAGAAFPPSSQILGAISVLVKACSDASQSFEAVAALFEKMSATTKRLAQLLDVRINDTVREVLVRIFASILRILALATKRAHHPEQAKKHGHERWHRVMRASKSNASQFLRELLTGGDSDIVDAVNQFEALVLEELHTTVTSTYKTARILDHRTFNMEKKGNDTNATVHLIADMLPKMLNGSAMDQKDREAEWTIRDRREMPSSTADQRGIANVVSMSTEMQTILRPTTTCPATLDTLRAERIPGTADRLVTNVNVQKWLTRQVQVLCVTGDMGSGKTFTAVRILGELQKRAKHDTGIEGPQMYTGYYLNNNETPNAQIMLRTLAFQLSTQSCLCAAYQALQRQAQRYTRQRDHH
ncbi:hypothetical protein F4780DRAFT_544709 [Xylariomycetidae sp. FL0641]|nr:hypothetical protein F4780DRAFT_544709 [Xylariomycetidae sp. FL0641]